MKALIVTILFISAVSLQGVAQNTSTTDSSNPLEIMPQFPGGEDSLMRYLVDNLEYPKMARDNDIEGIVYVDFVVCEDGKLCEIKTAKDIGGGCGDEVKKVVAKMPNWKPATFNGTPVRVAFTLPVSFTLTKREKRKARRQLKRKNKK